MHRIVKFHDIFCQIKLANTIQSVDTYEMLTVCYTVEELTRKIKIHSTWKINK